MTRTARLALILLGLTALAPAVVAQAAIKPAEFVTTQEGKLPVILSAPHGGAKDLPDVPARTGDGLEKGAAGFFAGRDTGTEELAQAISEAVEKKCGTKPYLVAARFHRKYIDANRPPQIAYQSKLAKPVYDHYRDTLAEYSKAVKKAHGAGLLLDVHGQGTAKDTVFRGTQNGQTVALLRQRFGEKAHTGPKSFFGLLAANGCTVFPPEGDEKERAGFTGGHIVRTYGGETFGIDAIQLEFGSDYRTKEKRAETADRVAAAVAEYVRLYLKETK